MRIVLISSDEELIKMMDNSEFLTNCQLSVIQSNPEPLAVVSELLNLSISILILDDDFVKPQSTEILRTIKKVSGEAAIIFITSDSSIELGREICQLGIQLYALKPVSPNTLINSIKSISVKQSNFTQQSHI